MIKINTKYTRLNPSPTSLKLIEYYKELRSKNVFKGISLIKHMKSIGDQIKKYKCKTLLDYGSGKGLLYSKEYSYIDSILDKPIQEYWGLESHQCYDPGHPEHSKYPINKYDIVISVDVLEHIPEEDLTWFIKEILSLSKEVVYINVACYPALKIFKDGTNVHVSIFEPKEWFDFIIKIWKKDFKHLTIFLVTAHQEMVFTPLLIKLKKGKKK